MVRVTQGFASLRPGLSNPAPFGAFPATPILDAAGIPRVSQNRARLFRLRLGPQIVGQVFQLSASCGTCPTSTCQRTRTTRPRLRGSEGAKILEGAGFFLKASLKAPIYRSYVSADAGTSYEEFFSRANIYHRSRARSCPQYEELNRKRFVPSPIAATSGRKRNCEAEKSHAKHWWGRQAQRRKEFG